MRWVLHLKSLLSKGEKNMRLERRKGKDEAEIKKKRLQKHTFRFFVGSVIWMVTHKVKQKYTHILFYPQHKGNFNSH